MELVKCPYCNKMFKSYNGLCKHVIRFKKHGEINKEQLLCDYSYNGIRPKCKCGCGEYTDISYEGGVHFCDYKLGHSSRIKNNWGHNNNAKLNSSNTRRKQYKDGERIQWNKGKTWDETYSDEKIKELMKVYDDVERNDKIRKKLKGVPKSEEHAKKCRENGSSNESREKISEALMKRIKENKFSLSSKLEKEFIDNFIKPLNIEFQTQFYLKDIKQYCDVYIPSKKLIIECDGSFWHCDPRLFPNGAKYEYQKERIKRDEIKNKYLYDNGYKILRCWELDIINNPKQVEKNIKEIL